MIQRTTGDTAHHVEADGLVADLEPNGSRCLVEVDKKGHRWGRIRCADCGMPPFTVWGTPRNPGSHAKDINRFVASHQHGKGPRS